MNSGKLLDEIKTHIKANTVKLFATIEDYGGEFSSDEIDVKSFNAPAVFVAALGWRKIERGKTLGGKEIWRARIALFVATKHSDRNKRMREAMERTEVLTALFQGWRAEICSGPPEEIMAENLYNRAVDKKGMALWMVGWWQEVEFKKQQQPNAPVLPDMKQVEISTTGKTHVPAQPETPNDSNVTHTLEMKDG
ncbi:hypothetical protein DXT88_22115 [Herbaspirillum lusitanum]|uniref:DUF1834 family protein n=1 Tax=Herbaspirillum lusitanum TaxID=213312 RepID=UPI002238C542|nr:DUF1834 family protein [Herbaspirillum lusitanum]MCW5300871.1 hypothetical protein [Herbaspirillum lusitanum]